MDLPACVMDKMESHVDLIALTMLIFKWYPIPVLVALPWELC